MRSKCPLPQNQLFTQVLRQLLIYLGVSINVQTLFIHLRILQYKTF
jgi:hypothetical protein